MVRTNDDATAKWQCMLSHHKNNNNNNKFWEARPVAVAEAAEDYDYVRVYDMICEIILIVQLIESCDDDCDDYDDGDDDDAVVSALW